MSLPEILAPAADLQVARARAARKPLTATRREPQREIGTPAPNLGRGRLTPYLGPCGDTPRQMLLPPLKLAATN
jgi:hypothetical protein